MNSRDTGYFVGGVAAAAVVTAGVAAWGSAPEDYRVSCRPDDLSKTTTVCSIVESGRFWSLQYGEYLHAESEYPRWQQALGEECAARYRNYSLAVERAWQEAPHSETFIAKAPHFYCYNEVGS
jgi:hypothetical protein